MAQDMQWPSEDEDFDAVTTADQVSTSVASTPAPAVPQPQKANPARSVSVSVSEPEEDTAADEPETPTEAPVAEAEPEAPVAEDATPALQEEAPAPSYDEAPAEAHAVPEDPTRTDESVPVKPPKAPRQGGNTLHLVVEALLVVALVAAGYYAFSLHKDNTKLKADVVKLNNNPQIVVQKQTNQLLSEVGSLMTLPQGETPTIASVSDAAKARQQSNFFANAENGDKVLMYVKAGQAILYRPSTHKIVLVAPLTFNNNTSATTPTTSSTTKR